jgi:hypothetical protein
MKRVSFIVASPHLPTVGRTVASILGLAGNEAVTEVLVMGEDRHGVVPRDRRVHVLAGLPPGPACYAYNAGLDMAHGDRLVLVDGDCVLDPGWQYREAPIWPPPTTSRCSIDSSTAGRPGSAATCRP